MTIKRFWESPYLSELSTCISAVDGAQVQLAETIFYAFSGGQESDSGAIGDWPVLSAHKQGAGIVYTLAAEHTLQPGQVVTVRIDWTRRYALMRLHFAAELVLELVTQRLVGIEKIGAHIAQDKARIDFSWPSSLAPLLPELTAQAQQLIAEDLPITSAFSDVASGRRYWQIQGFAQVPCGGTHLRRTGEVGSLRLKRKNVGRSKERIEIYLT